MKRLFFILLCCSLMLISSIIPTLAQELSKEMIQVVSKNLDNFFPLNSINETFSSKSAAVRGNIGPETATEVSTDGQRNILLYANPDGLNEYSLVEKLNAGNLKNFYYEMDVFRNDLYPSDGGGCYIGYINEFIGGVSVEEPVESVSLIISDAIYLETRVADSLTGTRTKLSDIKTGNAKLLIIRLTGETIFYVNGKLAGVYHDGKTGPFQLRYGVESFVNGEVVDCSFDNIVVRKVMP